MESQREFDLLRFLVSIDDRLDRVREIEDVLAVALRLSRDFFGADESCFAVLLPGRSRVRMRQRVPKSSHWEESLLAGFLRKERPDLVIAFGGFVTSGIVLSAWSIGCPLALHEANRRPGKAIRLFRRLADRLYLPDGIRLARVAPQTVKYYGYPLRREICPMGREKARKLLNIDIKGKLLAVIGGSQGAEVLNQWVMENWELLAGEGINIYCVTGLGKGVESKMEMKGPGSVPISCHFTPFTDDMSAVLCGADLVVSRAGAGSIAEIVHCRVPSILVPYARASDDHQMANARFLEQHGGNVVLHQNQIDELKDEVLDLIFNDWLLRKFRNNLHKVERGVSVERIASDLEELATHSHGIDSASRRGRLQIPA